MQVFTPARAIAQKAMSQPKPADTLLTKKGQPRKRAPGGGRKDAGRNRTLPNRVSETAHQQFEAIAKARGCTLTEAIEHAAGLAHAQLQKA